MHKVRELRKNYGYDVYFSIDTWPSLVLLTLKNLKDKIVKEIKSIVQEYDIIESNIGGPSKILDSNSPEVKKLKEDINKLAEEEIK